MISAAIEGKLERGKRLAVQPNPYRVLACKREVREYARRVGSNQNRGELIQLDGERTGLFRSGPVRIPPLAGGDSRYTDLAGSVSSAGITNEQHHAETHDHREVASCR